jgi:hypothetical protein
MIPRWNCCNFVAVWYSVSMQDPANLCRKQQDSNTTYILTPIRWDLLVLVEWNSDMELILFDAALKRL